MAIKSITITRNKTTFKNAPCTEVGIKVHTEKPGEEAKLIDAMKLLAEAMLMVIEESYTRVKEQP